MKKTMFYLIGLISGLINGLLGTGGGTIVVPAIEALGIDVKKSHSTAIAIILPITIVSSFFYFKNGTVDVRSTVIVSVSGCIGAVVGAKFLKKIPKKWLKILFGASMVIGGIRGVL